MPSKNSRHRSKIRYRQALRKNKPSGLLNGLTLVELVIVMTLVGILAILTPPLVFYGVKSMVFLPRALAVNQAAGEALHQLVEGGFSTLSGQTIPIRGLRLAVRRSATEPALWLAENDRVGFRTADGQNVLIRWDSTSGSEVVRRELLSPVCPAPNNPGEIIPYHAQTTVRILRSTQGALSIPIFRYYNQSGTLLAAPGCSLSGITTVRRVDIALMAQTGSGVVDEGQARELITTSVAIRVP